MIGQHLQLLKRAALLDEVGANGVRHAPDRSDICHPGAALHALRAVFVIRPAGAFQAWAFHSIKPMNRPQPLSNSKYPASFASARGHTGKNTLSPGRSQIR